MTLQDFLQDFVDVFIPFYQKVAFMDERHHWIGHFFAVDYFGEIRRKTSTTF